jgi:hypothetical protein
MVNHLFKIVIPVFILVAIAVGVISLSSGKSQKPEASFAASRLPKVSSPSPVPVTYHESKTVSPDGKMTLVMNEKKGSETSLWTFSVADDQIFKEALPVGVQLSVPLNTFSPDNKYVFLKKESSGLTSYLVLITNGKSISENSQALEFTPLFYEKYPDFKITEVTGWAAPNLLIINTNKLDGEEGPSFWFELPAKSFIQLSNRFN